MENKEIPIITINVYDYNKIEVFENGIKQNYIQKIKFVANVNEFPYCEIKKMLMK